jgi:DNA segregation ATPase FtsK/SpoIIIE-like protein
MATKKRTTKTKKTTKKSGTRQKSRGKKPSFLGRFFRFLFSPPVMIFILVVIVAGLIYWFWPEITRWANHSWDSIIQTLGIGLALIVILLAIITSMCVQGKSSLLFKRWNILFGGCIFAVAFWGLVTFFSAGLGGTAGESIISDSPVIGILRLCGLVLLGFLFVAARATINAIANIFIYLGKGIKSVWLLIIRPGRSKLKPVKSPELVIAQIEEEQEVVAPAEVIQEEPVKEISPPQVASEPVVSETWEPGKYQPAVTIGGWQLPPIGILDKTVEADISQPEVEKRGEMIINALASYNVDAKIVQINVGPTVTQFGVEPGWDRKFKDIKERDKDGNVNIRTEEVSKTRVKVERISSLANDLALALAAPGIRIEAPVPGKPWVGIEVPNNTFSSVNLRSIIESNAYQKTRAKSSLTLALGKGAGGETIVADLAKMPHLLIAGATGSGKSVFINSSICCLLTCNTPDDLKLIMIDPKRVELVTFDGLPHLVSPVVVDTEKAVLSLRWLTQEMDERYRKFAQAGARNIDGYNKDRLPGEKMPYIALIIDELADLMMTAFDEVEHTLCRLAQLSRATGIHLIVATQRPSVDVVTGLIKANFPTRISFALTSQVDSRTILDSAGADKLLGRGDMLYMSTDASKPKRMQGPFLSDAEIDRLVNFWKEQRRPEAAPVVFENEVSSEPFTKEEDDPLMETARQLTDEVENISASFLQRRLHIGYPRAARLYDKLKEEGY